MMKKIILIAFYCLSSTVVANDSTGFVGTGGVQYLKNKNIQMVDEDLFISKKKILVQYNYKNLSANDITETVLFPLPTVENYTDADFADTGKLMDSFTITANGQKIKPNIHIQAFMQPIKNGEVNWDAEGIDITSELKKCGLTDQELMTPWSQVEQQNDIENKIRQCQAPKVQQLSKIYDEGDTLIWSAQVIYSWKQTFKANAITHIQHEYAPLVGGSVALSVEYEGQEYCMDQSFKAGLKNSKSPYASYSALGYILKTGANWAKPIQNFRAIIERDASELVSFCWSGKVKKLSPTQFELKEKNFVPKQDLKIIFVRKNKD